MRINTDLDVKSIISMLGLLGALIGAWVVVKVQANENARAITEQARMLENWQRTQKETMEKQQEQIDKLANAVQKDHDWIIGFARDLDHITKALTKIDERLQKKMEP